LAASETYPDDLKYHKEHDWARIEGGEAVLGITWFAQDSLGELVHYEPPNEGDTISKDSAYGEVESVKAVSDVIAPLSGEVLEVNQKDGERRPVRGRLARADPVGRCRRGGVPSRRRRVQASRRRSLS